MDHQIALTFPPEVDSEAVLQAVLKAVREAGFDPQVTRTLTHVVVGGRFPRRGVGQPNEVIRRAFLHALVHHPVHGSSLCRQRPAGSQWGRFIPPDSGSWAGLAWREVPHDQLPPGTANPRCRYFKTNDPALLDGAVEHVGLSTEIARGEIFSARGDHGWELRTHHELPRRSATEAWLILGPGDDGVGIPWTAFPGQMAAAPPAGWDGDLSKLNLEEVPYGVKYVSPETVRLAT